MGATLDRRIAVVGAGVVTPAGDTVHELWAGLLAGKPAMAPYRHPELPAAVSIVAAEATGFDPSRHVRPADQWRFDRHHLFAIAAADDALAGSAGRPDPDRCALVCGVGYGAAVSLEQLHRGVLTDGIRGLTPFGIPLNMANSAAAQLALRYGFRGPCLTVSTACASGADAIGTGVELLRRDAADLVLAGGVDAAIAITTVLSFFRMGALTDNTDPSLASRPFDRDRDGFVLGEGAGFVVLQRLADVAAGEPVLGLVAGYGAGCDAHHIVAPRPDGTAARRSAERALADAGIGPADIGHINAHGTSTPAGDLAESKAMAELFGGTPPPVTAVKGITGHMIGGSGAVEAIVALLSLRHGLVPPVAGYRTADPEIDLDVVADQPRPIGSRYALSNSFGFGGHNAVLVLAAG